VLRHAVTQNKQHMGDFIAKMAIKEFCANSHMKLQECPECGYEGKYKCVNLGTAADPKLRPTITLCSHVQIRVVKDSDA